jgi:hypothetical protein
MVLLEELALILRVHYVASRDNPSDYFNRIPYKGEWLLDPELAHMFMRSHGGALCTVDRFADGLSALLPHFNSPYPCPGNEWVDAFSTSWEGEWSWINPPWSLLPCIVWKLAQEPRAAAVLLVPNRLTQSWFAPLVHMAFHVTEASLDPTTVSISDAATSAAVVPEVLRQGRSANLLLISVRPGCPRAGARAANVRAGVGGPIGWRRRLGLVGSTAPRQYPVHLRFQSSYVARV